MSWSCSFSVVTQPEPKGSKRLVRAHGVARMIDASPKTRVFEQAVATEASRVRPALPTEWPVRVDLTFRMQRPKSAPARVLYPAKKPDIDKLVRAVLDALTVGGIWRDDAQVVELVARKRFDHVAGVDISVREVCE